jgi:histone acetyltransferase
MSDDEVSNKKRKLSHNDDGDDDANNKDDAETEDDGGGEERRPSSSSAQDDSSPESFADEAPPVAVAVAASVAEDNTASAAPPRQRQQPPTAYDNIRRAIVINDGKRENLIRLIGLKSLFARQLPKMPKEYIARLVFDRRHKSLAILSNDPSKKECDDEIIGGICYRAYPDMRFAEIAFCAVSASQQVKGYGTKLMNLLKMHAVTEGIEYFITYADNYAIGYFKKQGFTKAISMPKGRYQGLIKDYDGGTIMECYVHPSIDFTRVPEIIHAQREFILQRIRAGTSKSDKVIYPPLPPNFYAGQDVKSRAEKGAAERALAIPGVAEAGWTMADLMASTRDAKDSDKKKHQLKSDLLALVSKVQDQQYSWCFRDPVDTNEVKDYLDVVSDPIDLKTMEKRIRRGDWYKTKHMLFSDMMKMVNNCKLYNGEGNTYYECAVSLEKYLASISPMFTE